MKVSTLFVVAFLTALMLVTVGAYAQRSAAKQRVANDPSGLYFKNRFGVYLYLPRDCGFLGCIGPDLRLVKYRRIPRADPATFEILNPPTEAPSDTGQILARDKRHVFYGGRYVPTGDVSTLRWLDGYAKDKNNLYLRGLVIRGVDIGTAEVLGQGFITDRHGLYLGNASPPRRVALADRPTFKILPRALASNRKFYVAEDKNFYYYSDGGSYRVDAKPGVVDFRKLGCGYYYFAGQIFYSVYQVEGADAATFRVLGAGTDHGPDVESCENFYAVDKSGRYDFELRVRPDDAYRNRQIDLLLATPEEKKKMSGINYTYVCVPESWPGVNFGYSSAAGDGSGPGTVTLLHFFEAGILDAHLTDRDGRRQPLPTTAQRGLMEGCNSVGVQKFTDDEDREQPWFGRRDPGSVSLVVNQFGQDPVFVVADNHYSIKLAFAKTSLIRLLIERLGDSRLTPFDGNVAGWGTGWILEGKFFVNKDGVPEVWVPLRIKNVPTRHQEGHDYVTVGFEYRDGRFECVDPARCSAWGVPQSFAADLK